MKMEIFTFVLILTTLGLLINGSTGISKGSTNETSKDEHFKQYVDTLADHLQLISNETGNDLLRELSDDFRTEECFNLMQAMRKSFQDVGRKLERQEIMADNPEGLEEYVHIKIGDGVWKSRRGANNAEKTCALNYRLKLGRPVLMVHCGQTSVNNGTIEYQYLEKLASETAEVLSCSCRADNDKEEKIHLSEISLGMEMYTYIHLNQKSENTYNVSRGWMVHNRQK